MCRLRTDTSAALSSPLLLFLVNALCLSDHFRHIWHILFFLNFKTQEVFVCFVFFFCHQQSKLFLCRCRAEIVLDHNSASKCVYNVLSHIWKTCHCVWVQLGDWETLGQLLIRLYWVIETLNNKSVSGNGKEKQIIAVLLSSFLVKSFTSSVALFWNPLENVTSLLLVTE